MCSPDSTERTGANPEFGTEDPGFTWEFGEASVYPICTGPETEFRRASSRGHRGEDGEKKGWTLESIPTFRIGEGKRKWRRRPPRGWGALRNCEDRDGSGLHLEGGRKETVGK